MDVWKLSGESKGSQGHLPLTSVKTNREFEVIVPHPAS